MIIGICLKLIKYEHLKNSGVFLWNSIKIPNHSVGS